MNMVAGENRLSDLAGVTYVDVEGLRLKELIQACACIVGTMNQTMHKVENLSKLSYL